LELSRAPASGGGARPGILEKKNSHRGPRV
jgi:hypothetical protein